MIDVLLVSVPKDKEFGFLRTSFASFDDGERQTHSSEAVEESRSLSSEPSLGTNLGWVAKCLVIRFLFHQTKQLVVQYF